MEAGAVTPPTATPTSEAPSQQDLVMAMLEKLTVAVQGFDSRLSAVENNGPKFVKATPETYGNDGAYNLYELPATRDQTGHVTNKIPTTSNGLALSDWQQEEYPARFSAQQRVRLNLDAIPHGHEDQAEPKTRGQLMELARVPNGEGVVIDLTFLSRKVNPETGRRGIWKYRVQFPKQVMPGANNGVVSLHEPELIPA